MKLRQLGDGEARWSEGGLIFGLQDSAAGHGRIPVKVSCFKIEIKRHLV